METLETERIAKVFRKGTDPAVDSYSGFFDNDKRTSTGLTDYLRTAKIANVFVVGLATDYCVKFTVLDALRFGFKVQVYPEGCRAVNLNPDDGDRALEEMERAGAVLIA